MIWIALTVGSNDPSMNIEIATNSTDVDNNNNTDIEMPHDAEASYETSAVATLSEGMCVSSYVPHNKL